MPPRAEAASIYAAAKHWAKSCLLEGGSVLGEGPLWTAENVRRLNAHFVENLLTDERSFLQKLEEQLASSPPEVKRLAAEMLWLMMLFPSNVNLDAKLRLVITVHGWSGASLDPARPLLRVLAPGVGSTGQAYNQHRWRELTLLIRVMVAWGELAPDERQPLLKNGWAFAEWLDKTPDAKNRQIRNILLHLLFPDLFERVSSFAHKRLIVRHFAPALHVPLPRESVSLPVDAFDRPLREIRRHLEQRYPGQDVDFYRPDIEAQWRPPRGDVDDPRPPRPGDPTALEMRLRAGLREVVQIHAKLSAAIPELVQRPTVSLLVSALIRSVENDRRDTARTLWEQINRTALPPEANVVLLLFGLPYDQVHESVYLSPGDVDVETLLGSSAGGSVRRILQRADHCAREVSGKAAPEVSVRHLVAAILQPGEMNEAKRALAKTGYYLARLRAGVMAFFQSTLVGEDLAAWRGYLDVPAPEPVLVEAGFARDYIDPEDERETADHLNVDPDVQALARLLCSTAVEPPLSVGLFADWGTGKSTFMQRLKRSIGELSARAEAAERRGVKTAYRSGVVSIWFNAWHYMDANLWASLVTRIFERLAEHLSGNAGERALEEMRRNLYSRLDASKALLREAEGRKALAEAEAAAAQERLDAARTQQAGLTRRIARARDVAAGLWAAISAEAASGAAPPAAPAPGGTTPAAPPARDAVEAQAASAADAALASLAGDVKEAVGAAAAQLGIPQARATVGEIRGSLAQMQGLWGSVSASAEILHRRNGVWGDVVLLLLAGLVAAATLVPAIVLFEWSQAGAWITAATGFLISLGPVLAVLAAVAGKVRRVLERADVEIRASTERAAAEADALQRALDQVKQEGAAAEHDRILAGQKVDQIAAEMEDIRAGRRLEQFIRDRAGSDDYRRHLGIIATIRQDFEALARLLEEVRREGAPEPAPEASAAPADAVPVEAAAPARPAQPVRRIILYIDDLDRCPEERVVEVLQAVHLLLAFPLFVVVVGVDSRWLLRAVQSQYERLLAGERSTAQAGVDPDDALRRASTPQNYLEKIFQIPFTLEPMDSPGFGRLLGSLLKVRPRAAEANAVVEPPANGEKAGGEAAAGAGPADSQAPMFGLDEQWLDEENDAGEEESPLPAEGDDDARLNPPGLEVEEWELAYLSGLAPLIGSPRMAKRFANVYRFIRAALAGPSLDEFTGTAERPGEFRTVSLLLALLTGFPGESVELFRRLLADDPVAGEDWMTFVRRIADEARAAPTAARSAHRWDRMLTALEEVEKGVGVAAEMEPYRERAPRVARFSFQTGQILGRRPASLSPPLPEQDAAVASPTA
ncbi:MAG TPA: P-loop NTPase fold protein [Longimicrobium sp.]|nr:P-loop NTPase fold protein [Longimicrobium sp.]